MSTACSLTMSMVPLQNSRRCYLQRTHTLVTNVSGEATLPQRKYGKFKVPTFILRILVSEVTLFIAETMKSYMDLDINPCTNFYDFACGNWDKHNQMPADRTTYDTFEILRESLDSVLQDLLTESFTVSFHTKHSTISVKFAIFRSHRQLGKTI